jgi:tripartite ATP-independent transporter DctP family solute receptor
MNGSCLKSGRGWRGLMTSLVAFACIGTLQPTSAQALTLRFGHVLPTTHPWSTCGIDSINAALAAKPEVDLQLEVFPGGQLGSNEELVASVAAGSLDMTLPGVGSVSPLYGPFGVLEAFFAFRDLDHLNRVWNSEIGAELREGASQAGIHVIGDLWYIGMRQITAGKPIRHPDDLAGMTMRSQDTPASFANIRSLGAQPTPIAFGELYLALSQGVVDSQENPIANILSSKFFEVQDYLSVTNHVPQMGSLLMNADRWAGLTDAQRTVLMDAANAAAAAVQTCISEQESATLDAWRKDTSLRMKIIDDVDRDAFQKRAQEFFAGPDGPEWKELYLRVQQAP